MAVLDTQERFAVDDEDLRLALVASRTTVWRWDIRADRLQRSHALEASFGLDAAAGATSLEAAFERDVHPDDRHAAHEAFSRAANGQDSSVMHMRMLLPDGRHRWTECHAYARRDVHGSPVEVIVIAQDVTEHKQAEEVLAARMRQRAAVADLGLRALQSTDTAALLREVAEKLCEVLEADRCEVLALSADGRELTLRAGFGIPSDYPGIKLSAATTPYDLALRTSKAQIAEDYRYDPRFKESRLAGEDGMVSGMSILIYGKDRPWGLIGAHTKQRKAFSVDDVNLLKTIANMLAMVFERDREEEVIREMSTPVLQIKPRVLLAPIVGQLDAQRTVQLGAHLLEAIRTARARAVVLDLTGAAHFVTETASGLIDTVHAARLLGAEVVVTGISAEFAEAHVGMWSRMPILHTAGDLESGIESAIRLAEEDR